MASSRRPGLSIFGSAASHSPNSPSVSHNTTASTGHSANLEDAMDLSMTIFFGPPECPDQTIMLPTITSKLPKSVLGAIMKSHSKIQQDLGGKAVLLRFSSPSWCKNLSRVNQYLLTGEYAPWNPVTSLEVIDPLGTKVTWQAWMSDAADIENASTTEETYKLFTDELALYNFACFSQYNELKQHSLKKIRTEFPILAREALAMVDYLTQEDKLKIPIDGEFKQLVIDAACRNKKTLALQPSFTKIFEKAIENNLPAKLLEQSQRDFVAFLRAELMQEQSRNSGFPSPPNSTGSKNSINRVVLCKAVRDGYDFRFNKGDVLIVCPEARPFNGALNNVVVENIQGQRGDMLRDLLVPLDLRSDKSGKASTALAEAPTEPKAMQVARSSPCNTSIKTEEVPSSDHKRSSRRDNGSSPARRRRSSSPDRRRRPRTRSRSPEPRYSDRWADPYGRR